MSLWGCQISEKREMVKTMLIMDRRGENEIYVREEMVETVNSKKKKRKEKRVGGG